MSSFIFSLKKILVFSLLALFCLSLVPAMSLSSTTNARTLEVKATPITNRPLTTLTLQYPRQFHDYYEMEEEIVYFHSQAPDLIDLNVIGHSYNGLNISCLRITNEADTRQKAKTLIVAHHHGREQITVEAALRLIMRLINNYGIDATLTEYVDTQEIYIIPSLNPDTLEYVVNQGNYWLRKNLRPFDHDLDGEFDEDGYEDINGDGTISAFDVYDAGGIHYLFTYFEGIDNDADGEINEDPLGYVDLNRNYASGFGNEPGSSADPYSDAYHGPSAFSEPETQVFRDFAIQHRFAMAYSLHSGINATYLPSDQYDNWVEPLLYTAVYNDLESLLPSWWNEDPGYNAQSSTSIHDNLAAGYYGLWQDWMYEQRNTAVPICFEIYRNASSVSASSTNVIEDNETHYIEEWTGIYGYFNPVDAGIDALWNDITPAFDYLLQLTPRLTATVSSAIFQNDTITTSINIHNLSPRLSTIDEIEFRNTDGLLIHTTPVIAAAQSGPVSLTLSQTELGTNNTLVIGNNYTGYIQLRITEVIPPPIPGFPITSILLGTIAAMGILIVIRRKRH
jgi:hypothetical protein